MLVGKFPSDASSTSGSVRTTPGVLRFAAGGRHRLLQRKKIANRCSGFTFSAPSSQLRGPKTRKRILHSISLDEVVYQMYESPI